jgi:hypothetical protein
MTNDARMRQALSLAAQLPHEADDVRGVIVYLQRIVDEFLIATDREQARPNVVALNREPH